MKIQNQLYLINLKAKKIKLETALKNLEKYNSDEESIRMIQILKDQIKITEKHINSISYEIKNYS